MTRSPVYIAFVNPLNLAMLVTALAAGLCSAWWLLPVGVALWIVMVVIAARDPSLRISHSMQNRTPLAQRFQKYFDRIERSQLNVLNALGNADSRTRRALQPVQDHLAELADQTYHLCERMTALENYRLVALSSSGLNLDKELDEVNARIEQATDPLVRREYEQSRDSLSAQLARLKKVSNQLDRVEAQLTSLMSQIDAAKTEVLRVIALGGAQAPKHAASLGEMLKGQIEELKQFEDELAKV